MVIFKTIAPLQAWLGVQKDFSANTGFVPTMGALHEGHLSIIRQCREEQILTVASIFINPTQFNNLSDYDKYPVTIEQDIRLLEQSGCDVLFLPSLKEMYPNGVAATFNYDLGDLEQKLEGKYRPGHFQGVCQVVQRLLEIVKSGHLYMGQKDYQQCMVIKKLLGIVGLPIQLHIVPTVRQENGLAMSSRNMRLDEEERKKAGSIYRQLMMIKKEKSNLTLSALKQKAIENLLADGFVKVDYVEIANAETLEPLTDTKSGIKAIALIAAYINDVRLIDNTELSDE